ncbi:MAG: hypothetical protein AAF939_22530, partial [Planctomycetota bacterium]
MDSDYNWFPYLITRLTTCGIMKSVSQSAILLFLAFAVFQLENLDASIVGYTNETNNRFTNSASFILNGFDLSGVGKEPDVTGLPGESSRWATAISRNVVIAAFHAMPDGPLHFHPDNDPTSTPVVRNVVSSQRVGATDLWIGVLDSNLPDTITHYAYATETLTGPDGVEVSAGSFQ